MARLDDLGGAVAMWKFYSSRLLADGATVDDLTAALRVLRAVVLYDPTRCEP